MPASLGFQVTAFSSEPTDADYNKQWNLRAAQITKAWEKGNENTSLRIAVIDSGVDPNHEDLVPYLEPLEDIIDEIKGSDVFSYRSERINYKGRDGNGHGTHVTGIIAAKINAIGIAGIVGGGIQIIPIKAANYRGGTDAVTLVAAIQRAIDRNANIINISIGGPVSGSTRALEQVVNKALNKNITIVAASGNESLRDKGSSQLVTIPAAYPDVIAVGAHTEKGNIAFYSNGGQELDLLAPGGGGAKHILQEGREILSTWPGYATFDALQKGASSSKYAVTSGTSMAAPHVTGTVALMLAQEPNLTPFQIRARLIVTADDLGQNGFDRDSGYGKLNAFRALFTSRHDGEE